MIELISIGCLIGLVCFIVGVYIGTQSERESWVVRADGKSSHYVDGTFYVIIEEGDFCKNYVLRQSSDCLDTQRIACEQVHYDAR